MIVAYSSMASVVLDLMHSTTNTSLSVTIDHNIVLVNVN